MTITIKKSIKVITIASTIAFAGTTLAASVFANDNTSGPTSGRGTFIFNPNALQWKAYGPDGSLVASGKASGGRNYCPDVKRGCKTPIGKFNVYAKGPVHCYSKKYPVGKGGAYMPYCMYFHGGYAIHGSNDLPNFNASHGCIRVHPTAAQWLYNNFVRSGTRVIVKSY